MNRLMKFTKPLLLGLLMTIALVKANAQEMDMSMPMHHHTSTKPKPVFLAMMDTMMVEMDKAPKGQSADAEFILQMIPHHHGAISMAKYEIAYGKDFTMIQLAKSILAEQSSELSQMNIWLNQHPANGGILPPTVENGFNQSMETMMTQMPTAEKLTNTDYAFAAVMLPHHQAAVDMAKVILQHGSDTQAIAFAKSLISNEQIEIEQMSTYIH